MTCVYAIMNFGKARLAALFAGTMLIAARSAAQAAPCAPDHLVKVVLSDVSPHVAANSFESQPRTYYRMGNDRLRIEEALDEANGIHELIVVSEPNIWMVNLYDDVGKHIVDPGPTFFARAPLFGRPLPGKLSSLEVGCESDFLAQNAAKPVRTEDVSGVSYDVYRVEDGDDAVEILERSGGGTPAFARYYHLHGLMAALRYDLYQTGLPNNPGLFSAPSNIHYTEAGQ